MDHTPARSTGEGIDFERHPSTYRHWQLDVDGRIATLTLSVDPARLHLFDAASGQALVG